ncbi:response regulator transcription factor [Kovacikia minuta]|uniref:response regulator transcription factor n=1 Tax=Kovacikia minuta TaxID=2931930 RepID=UPI0036F3CE69
MSSPELSGRELAVLRVIAQGISNIDIATALIISESTVESHRNRLLSKLGVSDPCGICKAARVQAVIVAVKRRLVSL